jgi:predicted nucleic acid-binding Zn ribbon protein
MNRDERGPTPLSEPLAEVSAALGLPAPDAVERLRAAWSEVVGTDFAAHSRIRTLRDGTLTIAVDAPAWATTLRYQRADLVARAASVCNGAVHDVRVVVDVDAGQ